MDLPAMFHCTHPPSHSLACKDECMSSSHTLRPEQSPHSITLRCHGEIRILSSDSILFAEIFDHELHIHTVDGKTHCGRGCLSGLKAQLADSAFLRCHKSYLVNLRYVANLCRYQITLANGTTVPVSKQNYLAIQQVFAAYA